MDAGAYPHPCDSIELIETHISWVLLTGEYVYKVKKPVDFGFLDFSTLERRRFFCHEEVRLNRRFAASLYVDVVAITHTAGRARIGGTGDVVDYAVRMRPFPTDMQLDRLLEAGRLSGAELADFAVALSAVHADAPVCDPGSAYGSPDAVIDPVRENFHQIAQSKLASVRGERVAALAAWSEAHHARLSARIEARRADGFVRECHGDLHLANLVRLADGIHAFDCIEFSEGLRRIDVISDVAFLVMDCCVRGRTDLAYAFFDRYLEHTGDYAGGALFGFYVVYRSMVRAKVAALRAQDVHDTDARRRYEAHVDFAHARALGSHPAMILMCGLSGSGKSWLAERLIERLPAVRIRSDVERKRLAELAPLSRSGSAVDEGLYAPERNDALYEHLARCAAALVGGGEKVIVDATFLDAARRDAFCAEARRLSVPCIIVHCVAPRAVLELRIAQRNAAGNDPSEATLDVLDRQQANYTPPRAADARVIEIDTSAPIDLAATARTIANRIERAG